jgi:glycosyltransferase involved in cell wall biosynthesis
VEAFDPREVLITDCWSFKPHLAEAFPGRRVWLRMQARECLCPLNNLGLLPDPESGSRLCAIHQAAFAASCRSCLRVHGESAGLLHRLDRHLSGVEHPGYEAVLRRSFRAAEGVLVLNPLLAESWRPYCRRVEVVTWGMDPARFPEPSAPPPGDQVRLLFAGVEGEWIKGYGVLRRAGELLWSRRRDFEIVLTAEPSDAGSPPLPFERRVGWQSQSSLARWYRETDITVVPTIAPDGLSRTSVEAMASGRPVVASRIGGLPYSVAEGFTGLLFRPGDAADLALQLERLLDSPELRRRYGSAGREEFQRRFTWPRVIESQYIPLLGVPEPIAEGAVR